MARALRSVKTFKKSWDADKALKSTYQGKFGKHQLRAYIILTLGYAIVAAWLTEMPIFACMKLIFVLIRFLLNIYLVLSPKYLNCTPIYQNLSNATLFEITTQNSTKSISNILSGNALRVVVNGQVRKIEPTYNYSREYGRSVLTDVRKN